MSSGIPDDVFYGKPTARQIELRRKLEAISNLSPLSYALPYRLKRPFGGPSKCWQIFRRQEQALLFQSNSFYPLMTIAFQHNRGERLFLVAHPAIFWFYDSKRKTKDRASYEVICENAVCKLYFDLEFIKGINPNSDGIEMTQIFIQIVNYFLNDKFQIIAKIENVLNLDSSTEIKFSKHLIYQIPEILFKNNYHVGCFVKEICHELNKFLLSTDNNDKFCNINRNEVLKLFIYDNKNNKTLFCDQGVYTKNRHFRLFGSSKLGKNAPLILAQDNYFSKLSSQTNIPLDEGIFINSLISFVENRDQKIIEVPNTITKKTYSKSDLKSSSNTFCDSSPFPMIDKYIQKIIENGKIYRWYFFSSERILVYDIAGYRFCGNIGRQHKSNNIKYIVNINEGIYYQKCYDSDCSTYRSSNFPLPEEVTFFFEDDSWLNESLDIVQKQANNSFGLFQAAESSDFDKLLNKESGIPEKDLMEIADVLETIDQMELTPNNSQ